MYKATFKILSKTFHSKGKTAIEAIENLKPTIYKGMGVLFIQDEKNRMERIVNGKVLSQLSGQFGEIRKQRALKDIMSLFDL